MAENTGTIGLHQPHANAEVQTGPATGVKVKEYDKFTDISRDDLLAVADRFGIGTAQRILKQVGEAVAAWPEFASRAKTDLTRSGG